MYSIVGVPLAYENVFFLFHGIYGIPIGVTLYFGAEFGISFEYWN